MPLREKSSKTLDHHEGTERGTDETSEQKRVEECNERLTFIPLYKFCLPK